MMMPRRAVGRYGTRESILSMLKAFVRRPRRTRPIVDLMAPPTPPATEVPPTTTAHTTNNGTLSPAIALAELSCDASITPAKAAVAPQMTYVAALVRRTLIPEYFATSKSPPTAYTFRPNDVLRRTQYVTATTASITTTRMGTGPKISRFARVWKSGSTLVTGCASVSCSPMPVNTMPMPRVMMNGSVRWYTEMNALIAPTARPSSRHKAIATGVGTPALINMTTTTPERAIMPPIERSTPPAISTNVSPIARMRKIELDFARSMKLTSVKNSVLVLGFRLNNAMAI